MKRRFEFKLARLLRVRSIQEEEARWVEAGERPTFEEVERRLEAKGVRRARA